MLISKITCKPSFSNQLKQWLVLFFRRRLVAVHVRPVNCQRLVRPEPAAVSSNGRQQAVEIARRKHDQPVEPEQEECGDSIPTIRPASKLDQFQCWWCRCSLLPPYLCFTFGENTIVLRRSEWHKRTPSPTPAWGCKRTDSFVVLVKCISRIWCDSRIVNKFSRFIN